MAGTMPIAVCCEMMDDESKGSMTTDDVEKYAQKNKLVFLSGAEVVEAYKEFKKSN
jgi:3,4-dihydroxy 2-butanone 4-phosphate synthase